jgi:prepilin-type N-terminal cleavage/methylation domain-containing protein
MTKSIKKRRDSAFTLIELLIVLSIIGTLVAVSAPTIFSMVNVAKDSTTKSNLHALRTAIFAYYVSNNESWPASLDRASGFIPNYMKKIPSCVISNAPSKEIRVSSAVSYGRRINNKGGWIYNPKTGEIRINYTGKDGRGVRYSSY